MNINILYINTIIFLHSTINTLQYAYCNSSFLNEIIKKEIMSEI
jgi:hypothetical protein